MLDKDELFASKERGRIWQKHCGFLRLPLGEFIDIQQRLLLEQIDLVADSPLGKKIIGQGKPKSVAEFRSLIPLTSYKDYQPYLAEKREDVLAEKPYCWAHTSGREGYFKWVPYTLRDYHRLIDFMITAFILASAAREGEVRFNPGARVMLDFLPRPYIGGQIAFGLNQRVPYQAIPPLEIFEMMENEEKMEMAFKMLLGGGVDFIFGTPSTLVAIGERFTEQLEQMEFSHLTSYPSLTFRLARAMLRSKMREVKLLPCDLWTAKGIISTGSDITIYHPEISRCWGTRPYNVYLAAEVGGIALPSWAKRGMIFTPYSAFLEFIPEEERGSEQPATVLLDEVESGKRYEIVTTNFYGMPFLRYRIGDIIKVVELEDEETNIRLPHVVFESRADEVIQISDSLWLDERKIRQAIHSSGVECEDWALCQEYIPDKVVLHLYLELKEETRNKEQISPSYLPVIECDGGNLMRRVDASPLKITLLYPGTFKCYYQGRQACGFAAAQLKPHRMNAPQSMIKELIRLSNQQPTDRM